MGKDPATRRSPASPNPRPGSRVGPREFELLVLNGSWLDAHECQQTPQAYCDLTFDLGSDSDYNLRVRAQCGPQLSAWTQLSRPFNRRDTLLTAPEMAVMAVGDVLQVTFNTTLPLTAVVSVTLWKKGEEAQTVEFTVPAEQNRLHTAALQEGAVYCVRAHTVLDTHLHSSSTDTQCVSITDADAAWKRPTTVTVTIIITAGLLFAVFWSVVHCHPQACKTYFHKEQLPHVLDPDWDIKTPNRTDEEDEICERVHVVLSDER
ncbi:hypothetical protein L3Q82_021115 [Scortum barcoo]|uniref:Uncharacterized protein n=1 Tax=Scortum barcoo TaxID=214431 RepID=A0ACB8X4B7_9TELE|nr:hypothetical protein L3Q82_021115 [Scortum barcoo]